MSNQTYSVSVVGATGLVGEEMLRVLESRKFPIKKLRAFASENSAGLTVEFNGQEVLVEVLDEKSLLDNPSDFVLFATSGELSAKYVPIAARAGSVAIDNSSFFRMNAEVPLVVPEVNPQALSQAEKTRVIANPNCSTIQLVVALQPFVPYGLERVIVSTYQSVSGAGTAALEELQNQIASLYSHGEISPPKVFPHQIAFNCIPQIDVFIENGFTKEEMKIILESRKIMGLKDLKITATAVRVPTMIGHCESVNMDLRDEVTPEEARDILAEAGVSVMDDPQRSLYPLNFEITGNDGVYVGRIRRDESIKNGLHFWVVADNLRKGAAANAVQIAELWIEQGRPLRK